MDAKQSRFIVETQTSGLTSLFGHDHKIEVGEFTGVATVSTGALAVSKLDLSVNPASLKLVDEPNVGERQAVEAALRDDVLETAKYPQITFKTKLVGSERRGDGTYDVRLTGELFLHGVRRTVTVPARVSLEGETMHAIGLVEIRQTDFKITPFSFVKGTVAIRDAVILSFDIVATRG